MIPNATMEIIIAVATRIATPAICMVLPVYLSANTLASSDLLDLKDEYPI